MTEPLACSVDETTATYLTWAPMFARALRDIRGSDVDSQLRPEGTEDRLVLAAGGIAEVRRWAAGWILERDGVKWCFGGWQIIPDEVVPDRQILEVLSGADHWEQLYALGGWDCGGDGGLHVTCDRENGVYVTDEDSRADEERLERSLQRLIGHPLLTNSTRAVVEDNEN